MSKTLVKSIPRYYPKSDGIIPSKPNSCYCGNGDNFTKITLYEKNSNRYMCKNCKKSYIIKNPQFTKTRLKKMGGIFDNIVFGMSSRETCLRMFIEWGDITDHTTILRWSNQYLQYAKMFTDDILCCLEYGVTWGIDGYLNVIESIDNEINHITEKIDSIVQDDENATILTSMPCMGYYSALLLSSEIADINRFSDSHHLCSYSGLVPSTHSSGGITYHGNITKTGSRHMRWVLTQCVHSHVRYPQDSNITRFYQRLSKRKGKSKATMATASKMLRVIYWMLKEKREYQNYG